jgi:hypothetical protein
MEGLAMTVKLQRCNAGHHYDPTQHSTCPFCGIPDLGVSATRPMKDRGGAEDATFAAGMIPKGQVEGLEREKGVTVGYFQKKIGLDPVVGWLVCTAGPDRGRDYRLHSERNFIGRSEKMDVCIRGDDAISRENHTVVTFNPRTNAFKLQPGEGRGLVYLNGEDLDVPISLKPYDIIELGETKLVFIPFCGEKFQWEQQSPE